MRTRRKMSGIYAPETASVSAARWDVGKAFCVAKKNTWLIAKNTRHLFQNICLIFFAIISVCKPIPFLSVKISIRNPSEKDIPSPRRETENWYNQEL